jgi:Lactate racemase N-terminal domain
MFHVRQQFDAPRLADVAAAVRGELERIGISKRILPGQTVAITAGSRGIANIALIIRTIVQALQAIGAAPFIVPAMGTHGSGTAEGQRKIIESYGITEEFTGAPIRSSMEVDTIGTTEDGIPIYFDREAHRADHVAVVGRIKPHTGFVGEIESGLFKMMMIGLGKYVGASVYHRAIVKHSFDRIIRTVGRTVLTKCHIAFGLGIVENGYDETAKVEAVLPDQFEESEKALLILAKRWMPKLPVDRADLLIIDRMGKNISGAGMDTNITGRKDRILVPDQPQFTRVFVRELTPETHGNAAGIGLADFTTTRLVRSMDYRATVINCVTAAHPEAAVTPVHYDTDREVIDAALSTIGLQPPEQARIIRIADTLQLAEVEVSETCLTDLKGRPNIEILDPSYDLAFDGSGNLLPLVAG